MVDLSWVVGVLVLVVIVFFGFIIYRDVFVIQPANRACQLAGYDFAEVYLNGDIDCVRIEKKAFEDAG